MDELRQTWILKMSFFRVHCRPGTRRTYLTATYRHRSMPLPGVQRIDGEGSLDVNGRMEYGQPHRVIREENIERVHGKDKDQQWP